ncbi:MAG: isocitrate lyase/phosphoenolpyruvate mutase family protein [Acidimicrobiales bacterium]|jgi:2-methylisocitrate lyase-like PEP mutase family enzyme
MDDARRRFRDAVTGPDPVIAPLCLDPLSARLIEEAGLGAGYLSGGALGFQYAIGEALLSYTEIADVARRITARSGLPLIVDGGVGFGDPVHTARATALFEATGAVAVEYEDQVAPKRLHHHIGVEHLVAPEDMAAKITAAADSRSDADFLIIARTGGFRHEGFDAGVARLEMYRDAGADILMAFCKEDELASVGSHFDVPLATITGLDHHTPDEWQSLGWNLIIDAFTSQALAITHTRRAYAKFVSEGTTGLEIDGMGLHRELVTLCGLEPFLDIERATTERLGT